MSPPMKIFKSHSEQIALLRSRGMLIEDEIQARYVLEHVNYYRLSGYWYPYRQKIEGSNKRSDNFIEKTSFSNIFALYEFDQRFRTAVFNCLTPIELALRARLGHELGRIDPLIHLRPELLGPSARRDGSRSQPSNKYRKWECRYNDERKKSREDFVVHHMGKYGGQIPIWAAVEIMDWGLLSHLYRLSPPPVRDIISGSMRLTAAQLGSWIKALIMVRNYSTHHARMFNRVYTVKPKFPPLDKVPELSSAKAAFNRCFCQLTLIQYLLAELNVGNLHLLPEVLVSFPCVSHISISHMGVPRGWKDLVLWKY